MSNKKWAIVAAVLVVTSLLLTACPSAAPEVQVVKETVVVEKEVVKEVQVEVTPTPLPPEKKLRVNLGTYPDIIDPQKSSFVNEIAHLKLIYEGLTRLDKDLQTVPVVHPASIGYNKGISDQGVPDANTSPCA